LKKLSELGVDEVRGHLLFAVSDSEYAAAFAWLERVGLTSMIAKSAKALKDMPATEFEAALDKIDTRYVEIWQKEAGLRTYGGAVADALESRIAEGQSFDMTSINGSRSRNRLPSTRSASAPSRWHPDNLGLRTAQDSRRLLSHPGRHRLRHHQSLAVAPFADILWMETKTADLHDAKKFAEAIHAQFPDKMLAYNLSPSFSWDTTGMDDEQMKRFPEELGKLGFVFNFITYGGHQIDGLAAEEFATALKQDGMLALARLQRKFRLLESPYVPRNPWSAAHGSMPH